MFCIRCGSRQADGARFCTSCGNPLALAAGGNQGGPLKKVSSLPRANPRNLPPVLIYLVLGFFACSAAVLAVVLPRPPEPLPAPSAGDTAMQAYAPPSPETETPLYTVLTKYTWELSGYADNPGQGGGPSRDFDRDSFGGDTVCYTFSDDGSTATKVVESPGHRIRRETSVYEILSVNCCDVYSEEDCGYWRFCLCTDGNLYAAITNDAGPQSDYAVFRPVSPQERGKRPDGVFGS